MSKLKSVLCVALALVFLMSANALAAKIGEGEEEPCACSHPNPGYVYYGTEQQFVLGDACYYYSNKLHYRLKSPLRFCELCQTTFVNWSDSSREYESHDTHEDCSWCDGTYTYRAYICSQCNHQYTSLKFNCIGDRCPYPHNQTVSIIEPGKQLMAVDAVK